MPIFTTLQNKKRTCLFFRLSNIFSEISSTFPLQILLATDLGVEVAKAACFDRHEVDPHHPVKDHVRLAAVVHLLCLNNSNLLIKRHVGRIIRQDRH